MESLRVDSRVSRGPDWPAGSDHDGGEGALGTVVEICASGNTTTACTVGDVAVAPTQASSGKVVVQWDSGTRSTCLYGKDGKYEVRLVETTTASGNGKF